jgi:hypothetical protein
VVKTDKEVLAGLGAAHRAALEDVFGTLGQPGAARISDTTDDKRSREQRRAANAGAGNEEPRAGKGE